MATPARRPAAPTDVRALRALDDRGDVEQVAAGIRALLAEDPHAITKPFVRDWIGRRWRSLFVAAAAADRSAVREAGRQGVPLTDLKVPRLRDRRSPRQRVAERFLHGESAEAWREPEVPFTGTLPQRTTVVFCPGLINTLIPVHALADALPALADTGVDVMRAYAHPMRSTEANVVDLAAAVQRGEGLDAAGDPLPAGTARPPGDVVLVGYSKGGPDAATLLAARPDLAGRVRAVVGWAGAFGGSYVADDLLPKLPAGDIPLAGDAFRVAVEVLAPVLDLSRLPERLDEYDVRGAIASLTTTRRSAWAEANRRRLARTGVPFLTISAVTSTFEVPYFQAQGESDIRKRAGDNDMQLSVEQSSMAVRRSVRLGQVHAHHWDLGYPAFPRRFRLGANLSHPFPRSAMLLAVVQVLSEVGLAD
jgi:hypothetical protein